MAINGFTTCRQSAIGSYRIPGTNRSVWVRKEIAPLLLGFAAEFHQLVEPIDGKLDDWGYACRAVRDRVTPSFHAAGIALDLNATRHPLGRRGTFNARQTSIIRALCRKYGLRWGGDYKLRKDEMHVEVILPRAQALALVYRLQRAQVLAPKVTAKAATRSAGDRVLRVSTPPMTGQDVKNAQHALAVAGYSILLDGRYGPGTASIVQRFQAKRHLDADGVCGPATWAALREVVH